MKLAIATLAYNQPQLVEALSRRIGMSLIVIDNGSNPPLEYPHRLIRLEENGYFAGGWNAAMPQLDAEWVAMLNSDITRISERTCWALAEEAERKGWSAISPAFNSPHAHMHTGGEVRWLDWTAVVMRKDHWLGFNADVFPGYGADLDLCYRMKQAGYRLGVSRTERIHHLGSVTALAEGLQGVQGNVARMNEGFQRLYGVRDWTAFVRKYLD